MEEKEKIYRRILEKSPRLYAALDSDSRASSREAFDLGGALVFGPALGGFLLWLLRDALLRGKERLYFLSRDGYFFWKGAQLLCREHSLPLDCRYLSCSRYSLRVPCYHLDHEAALDFICRDGLEVTPKKLLARAALGEGEIREVLGELNLPWKSGEIIPRRDLPRVREQLARSESFLARMDSHSRRALPLLEKYLAQEGLIEAAGDALVDSGWVGSVQKTLGQVLRGMGRKSVLEGYYWGLYDLPEGVRRRDYRCFYFSPEGNLIRKARFNNCLFEAVFTAPHGMTVEYRNCGGAVIPVYAPLQEQRRALTQRLGREMLNYLETLSKSLDRRDFFAEGEEMNLQALGRLLEALMLRPSLPEAKSFGSIAFCDDVLSWEQGPLAAPLTGEKTGRPFGQSAWYPPSALLAGESGSSHLRAYLGFQYLRQLRRILAYRQRKRKGEILP